MDLSPSPSLRTGSSQAFVGEGPEALPLLLELVEHREPKLLEALGGVEGIAKRLRSDLEQGLTHVSDEDLSQRRRMYGQGEHLAPPQPAQTAFRQLFWDAMTDGVLLFLLVVSFISMVLGAVLCNLNLGLECPATPLWGLGIVPKLVRLPLRIH